MAHDDDDDKGSIFLKNVLHIMSYNKQLTLVLEITDADFTSYFSFERNYATGLKYLPAHR